MANMANVMSKESFDEILPIFKKWQEGTVERDLAEPDIVAILKRDKLSKSPDYTACYILETARDLSFDEKADHPPTSMYVGPKRKDEAK